MRSYRKALTRWIPLWVLGPFLLGFPARLVVLVLLAILRGLAQGLLPVVGVQVQWPGDAMRVVENAAVVLALLGLGWLWARGGARHLLAPEPVEHETLDRRQVALQPTRGTEGWVAALGTLPLVNVFAVWWLHDVLVRWLAVDFVLWPLLLVLGLMPALAVIVAARSLRAPRLVQTPTSLTLERPLRFDRRLILSEIQGFEVDDEGELRIQTRGRRILAGRVELPLPEGLPALLGQVEARVEEGAEARVDPELQALRDRQRESE